MADKIKIQMFGMKDEVVAAACGWGPSVSCGPSEDPTTIEMYNELNDYLQSTELKDRCEFSFIDLMEDDLVGYEYEKSIINKGYQLPITFINGKAAFSGKLDNKKVYGFLRSI